MELVIDLLALVTWPVCVRDVWVQRNAFTVRVVDLSCEPLERKIHLVAPRIAKDLRVAFVKSDFTRLYRVGRPVQRVVVVNAPETCGDENLRHVERRQIVLFRPR